MLKPGNKSLRINWMPMKVTIMTLQTDSLRKNPMTSTTSQVPKYSSTKQQKISSTNPPKRSRRKNVEPSSSNEIWILKNSSKKKNLIANTDFNQNSQIFWISKQNEEEKSWINFALSVAERQITNAQDAGRDIARFSAIIFTRKLSVKISESDFIW